MENKNNIISNFINENIIEMPLKLRSKLYENESKYKNREEFEYIKRDIDDFIDNSTINRFLVLPGIRGVGKTTLLYQLYEYIYKDKNIPSTQILYFSCEELNDLIDCSITELIEVYLKNFHDTTPVLLDKKIFLMIDESQYDKNWSLAGKIIYDKSNNIFMIFTGSSALNLEYNANAARRLNKIEILPLTYSHHLKLKYGINLNNNYEILFDLLFNGNIDESQKLEFETRNKLINTLEYTTVDWDKYIFYGGYPVYFNEKDNKVIRDKIVEMTKKVVNTDMLNIKNISEQNQTYSNRIIRYLASV